MSRYQNKFKQPPSRWLNCPRKSNQLIANKFLAFKTPLSSNYDSSVPEACRWDVSWVFNYCKSKKWTMGLWIDLTNTDRFYNKEEIEKNGCKYVKLSCKGHGETPSAEQTKLFIQICQNFIRQHPLEIIGVHCTHGFNRTGFLICSYFIEDENYAWPIEKALKDFADSRPPGIYKQDYIMELCRRYDDISEWEDFSRNVHPTPQKPAWCYEVEGEEAVEEANNESTSEIPDSGEPAPKRRRAEKNPVFMANVAGVTPVKDYAKLSGVQKKVQHYCAWKRGGFPGCQPVSMSHANIKYLSQIPYRVSWKADGTRYMMLIESNGDIYFLDRDNSVFQVMGLTFLDSRDLRRKLNDTLLDGEMVIDKDNGREIPRYLVYDVIMYNGKDVSNHEFFPTRYGIIEREIIDARTKAFTEGRLNRDREPFSVRAKHFWNVNLASNLLSDKFAKQLSHEPDGLIFQPSSEPYVTGPFEKVLKWKPETHNSVDFKLKVTKESGLGMLPRDIGELYVGGFNRPFNVMKVTKKLKELHGKIIECKFENGQWIFMRERTDKSFPNSYDTAMSVCQTIRNPVTKDFLLEYIKMNQYVPRKDDSELMPPPQRR